jgi:two-component system sensor histidine kinase/response regulator
MDLRKQDFTGINIVMMLSSDGLQAEADRCRESGIARYLVKPASANDLREAIQSILRHAQEPREAPQASRPAEQSGPLRILLAEDNLVNQKVAVSLLTRTHRPRRREWPRGRRVLLSGEL